MAGAQRVRTVVRHTAQLPQELIHKVFDDLPLYEILEMACSDIPVLNETVLSHLRYQRLFQTPEDLGWAKAYFKLYLAISKSLQWPRAHPRSRLSRSMASSAPLLPLLRICTILHMEIYRALQGVAPHLGLLNQYLPTPMLETWDSSSVENLQERWDAICTAEAAINVAKARQLNLLADFKARYPDMLRWAFDTMDDRLKLNTQHIVSRFRVDAATVMQQTRFVTSHLPVKYVFRHDMLPLAPYDWCLRLFLATLEKFPVQEKVPSVDFGTAPSVDLDEDLDLAFDDTANLPQSGPLPLDLGGVDESLQIMSNENQNNQPDEAFGRLPSDQCTSAVSFGKPELKSERCLYPYPPAVAKDIATAISGLAYINKARHPSNSIGLSRKVPRTKNNAYSAIPYDKNAGREPAFITPPRVAGKARWKGTRLMPHHGKEYEWLWAFLRSVEYMRTMLDEGERREFERVEERERRAMEGMMAVARFSRKQKKEQKKLYKQEETARRRVEREQQERIDKDKRGMGETG